jgi:hypothetical protein
VEVNVRDGVEEAVLEFVGVRVGVADGTVLVGVKVRVEVNVAILQPNSTTYKTIFYGVTEGMFFGISRPGR